MAMTANCQKCKQPLKLNLDDSIAALSPSAYDIISASVASNALTSYNPRVPPSLRQAYNTTTSPRSYATSRPSLRVPSPYAPPTPIPPYHPSSNPADSFVVLTESVVGPARTATATAAGGDGHQAGVNGAGGAVGGAHNHASATTNGSAANPTALTPRLNQLGNLYQILSASSSIDHPLCTDCMELLIGLMTKELEDGKREKDRLVAFERDAIRKREEAPISREALQKEISKYERAERQATEDLKSLEAERLQLEKEKAELDEEEAALAAEEEAFWRDHSRHLLEAAALRDKANSLQMKYAHEVLELEKLNKANVYTDAFCIGHDGSFGTINKLRLGRLSIVQVEWPEINAAWGHTLLLLHTIARKLNFTFETYKLVPLGSFSRIEKLEGGTPYELYGSGEYISRMLQNRRFDQGMVAFLDCLRQMMEYVQSKDKTVKFPHAVHKDRIGDVSIKYQFTMSSMTTSAPVPETWTRALRHVLFDLKILLARATA